MTAQTRNRAVSEANWRYKEFTLASGTLAYQGSAIFFAPSTQKVGVTPSIGSFFVGFAVEKVDATLADKPINVELPLELHLRWFVNATAGDAVLAADVMRDCYFLDDQTVTITATAHPLAGRVRAVDATKGVLVELRTATEDLAPLPALSAFAANDCAPTTIVHGAIYDVPATAGVSTITLPAAAPDGTVAYFTADGAKNGHTVQYRDATGPTNLTTALTASKRHTVIAVKRGGAWSATAYVSP